MTIKILVVDDHALLRAGLRVLLNMEKDMQVVGEAGSAEETLPAVLGCSPDVVLMDVSLPGASGIEATKWLMEQYPALRVLLLTFNDDPSLLREALQYGAAGYILKRAVERELTNAIRSVVAGKVYIHPDMARAMAVGATGRKPEGLPGALTPREIEVLRLISQGYTNRQIAELLTVSIRTVESHRLNLMSKLNLHSRVELVRYAAHHGLADSSRYARV